MTHTSLKTPVQRSVGLRDRVETKWRTDADDRFTFPATAVRDEKIRVIQLFYRGPVLNEGTRPTVDKAECRFDKNLQTLLPLIRYSDAAEEMPDLRLLRQRGICVCARRQCCLAAT